MTNRWQLSALAMITAGSLLGYEAASKDEHASAPSAVMPTQPDPNPVGSTIPEFVIDDCCTFPGMTEADFRDAMQKQRTQLDADDEFAVLQE